MKQEYWKSLGKIAGGLLVIILFCATFGFVITHPPQSGMDTWRLEIRYSEHRIKENITCPEQMFEDMAFMVKFEVYENHRYVIWYGEGTTLDNTKYFTGKHVSLMFFNFRELGFITLDRYNDTLGFYVWVGEIEVRS